MITEKYKKYLKSHEWKIKSRTVILNAEKICQRCYKEKATEVHHLTYDNIYNEDIDDLIALCSKCHAIADNERKQKSRREKYNKAMDTYATKKYGEDWDCYGDSGEIEDEFSEWLEEKEYDRYGY